jgi:hypothetical protein
MTPIVYLKLQAKNLFRDYKTRTSFINKADGNSYYKYEPKYFDVDSILLDYDWNEENFSLMKAQHTIALMAGFRKWADLSKASKVELELAKLLFDNQDKINAEEWGMYIVDAERQNNTTFDPESRLEIFKQVFVNVEGHRSDFVDYRLNKRKA